MWITAYISFWNNSSLFLPKTSKLLPTIKACWWVWKDTKINSSRILFGVGELYLTEIYGVQIILVSLFLVKNISVSEENAFMCVFSSRVLIFLSFTLWAISTLNWSTSVLKDTKTFCICYSLRDKGQMEFALVPVVSWICRDGGVSKDRSTFVSSTNKP